MPDQKRPTDDSRWSTREVLEEPAEGSQAWNLRHLRAKLTLLRYHPKFRKYRKVLVRSAVGVALALGLFILAGRLGWFHDRGDTDAVTTPSQPPRTQENAASTK